MARTAPVPNIPPIPGMCPGVCVAGGGGGSGGGSGNGAGSGGDGTGGNGEAGADGTGGDGRGAGACGTGSGQGCPNPAHGGNFSAGDPVDIATGAVITESALDLALPGPLPLRIWRRYSSRLRRRDVGLGHGWTHSLAWSITERRRYLVLKRGDGGVERLPKPEVGEREALTRHRIIERTPSHYVLRDHTDRLWSFRSFEGSDDLLLFEICDANGNCIILDYDARGRLTSITDSVFRAIEVRWDGAHIAGFYVRNGAPGAEWVVFHRYRYDGDDLTEVQNAEGALQRFRYQDHLLTTYERADGMCVNFVYREHRCVETWCDYPGRDDPSLASNVPTVLADHETKARGVLHCKLLYDDGYVEVVDSRQLRRYFLNDDGGVEKATWGAGVWTRQLDGAGQLTGLTDPDEATWRWQRNSSGQVVKAIDPLLNETQIAYDGLGNIDEMTDALGFAVHYEFDHARNLRRVHDTLGDVVAYERDDRGLVTKAVMPNGGITLMAYDDHGNRTEVVEPDGDKRAISYDFLGRVVSFRDSRGFETRFTYTPMGNLESIFEPNGGSESFGYDAVGRLVRLTDQGGRTVKLFYAGHKAVHRVERPSGEGIDFRYDREGDLTEVINERGEFYKLTRDPGGRITSELTFDVRLRHFTYDGMGRIKSVTDNAGEITLYSYDGVGRLQEVERPDGTIETYAYDALHRVVRASNGRVVTRYEYDERGAVTKETTSFGGRDDVIEVTNDILGKPSEIRTSFGLVERIKRNHAGLVTSVELDDTVVVGFGWSDRMEVRRELPHGGLIEQQRSPIGLVDVLRVTSPTAPTLGPEWVGRIPPGTVLQKGYAYNAALEVETVTDLEQPQRDFRYDAMSQLVEVKAAGDVVEAYGYDVVGNRLAGQGEFYAEGGRLLATDDEEFAYDELGRLAKAEGADHTWEYSYDATGLLSKAERSDGLIVHNDYDIYARRVQKRVLRDGRLVATIRYTWFGDHLIHERGSRVGDEGDPVVEERTYAYGPDLLEPLAEKLDGEWRYVVPGQVGMPAAIVDGRGRVLENVELDAWGGGASNAPFRYLGQTPDPETGLIYNRYRFYDPAKGRYLSPDPVGFHGTLRPYAYAENRPFVEIDPLGLQCGVTITRRDGSTVTSDQRGDTHPAVDRAMSPCSAHSGGAPRIRHETPVRRQEESGGRRPSACAEPGALSNHLWDWESRNCPPQARCDPDTDAGRASLGDALDEIDPNGGIRAQDERGAKAPCANCSQTIPELWRLTGRPPGEGGTPPHNVIAPGLVPRSQTTSQFTAPQNTRPRSYERRLRDHNRLRGDNRVVHSWDPNTGWSSAAP